MIETVIALLSFPPYYGRTVELLNIVSQTVPVNVKIVVVNNYYEDLPDFSLYNIDILDFGKRLYCCDIYNFIIRKYNCDYLINLDVRDALPLCPDWYKFMIAPLKKEKKCIASGTIHDVWECSLKSFNTTRLQKTEPDSTKWILKHVQGGAVAYNARIIESIGGFQDLSQDDFVDIEISLWGQLSGYILVNNPYVISYWRRIPEPIEILVEKRIKIAHSIDKKSDRKKVVNLFKNN